MSIEGSLKRTPLFESHLDSGGRLINFAGWEMPVQYSGILSEVRKVREGSGMFDVSHMGQIFLDGNDAEYLTNKLVSSNNKLILKYMVGNNVKFIDCSCNGIRKS